MKNKWELMNSKCFLELKKVGDLQCYGIPHLSLYYDVKDKRLFLSLPAYKRDRYSSWLFFQINKEDVLSYLNSCLSLREWMKIYKEDRCYLKMIYNDKSIEWYESAEIPENLLSEDNFFDEDFCKDTHRINRFFNSGVYTIINTNIHTT